jgi:uncharacterized membrane protein
MPRLMPWQSFSGLGVLVGAVFFAASLTPSLIPRTAAMQGALGGVSFALGYALGVLLLWLWWYLELPAAGERLRRLAVWSVTGIAGLIVVAFLWRAAEWQNSIRLLMGMPPVDSARPLEVGLIAAAVAVVLILIGKGFLRTRGIIARRFERVMPRRVSQLLGIVGAVALFFLVIDGVLLRAYLRTYDAAQAALDSVLEPDVAPPGEPWRTGSAASLVSWQDLGRQGRAFVGTGPTGAEIAGFLGREATDPLRVYVGLNAAETPEERAALALEELQRVGGFERPYLVVAVPTGTGWVDAASVDPMEYLLAGDVATVAVQYSYLESWVSLLVEPEYSAADGAGALPGGLSSLDDTAARDAAGALPPRAESRLARLGAVAAPARRARRPGPGRGLGGPALPEPGLAPRDGRARARHAVLAAGVRRRLDHPLHQPGERP